jgi:hypothetical protein
VFVVDCVVSNGLFDVGNVPCTLVCVLEAVHKTATNACIHAAVGLISRRPERNADTGRESMTAMAAIRTSFVER